MPWIRFRILAALLVALALPVGAQTHVAQSPYLGELTWTELRVRIGAGATTVIVPVGGTEQSGPHIALGKHNARARILAGRIAERLGNALVAPVVSYVPEGSIDPPTGHMRFPGTISIPESVFEATLEAAGRSLRHAGFRDIVLIGDHGGYQKGLVKVAAKLNREWAATPARAHAVEAYYRAADVGFANELRREGHRDDEIGTHAGLADTALTLALAPQLVRRERLQAGVDLDVTHGVHGDPRGATAEIGARGVEQIVAAATEAIRRDVARH